MGLFDSKNRFWLRYQWMRRTQRSRYVPEIPIYLIHIPKTAGTSFRNMLFRVIDQDVCFPNLQDLGLRNGDYPAFADLEATLAEANREIRFLAGHYPFAAGELLPEPRQYFVFLRDPVARTISNLKHFKQNEPSCQELSLLEIFDRYEAHLENFQTRFLCDTSMAYSSTLHRPDLLTQASLDHAKVNLDKCTFIGLTEEFETSLAMVESLLGISLGRELKRNVSKPNNESLDAALINRLKPHLALDADLYQHALELFERQKTPVQGSGA